MAEHHGQDPVADGPWSRESHRSFALLVGAACASLVSVLFAHVSSSCTAKSGAAATDSAVANQTDHHQQLRILGAREQAPVVAESIVECNLIYLGVQKAIVELLLIGLAVAMPRLSRTRMTRAWGCCLVAVPPLQISALFFVSTDKVRAGLTFFDDHPLLFASTCLVAVVAGVVHSTTPASTRWKVAVGAGAVSLGGACAAAMSFYHFGDAVPLPWLVMQTRILPFLVGCGWCV